MKNLNNEGSLKRRKKTHGTSVAAVTLALVTMTMALCYLFNSRKKEDNSIVVNPENMYGYMDIEPDELESIPATDFVVYHIGNHNTFGTFSDIIQENALMKCEELGISRAIIIDSEAICESDICLDLEYAKSIIRDYIIDLPVYLNINAIMTNQYLNISEKTNIIMDFVNKAEANNIYVGLYGTSTNLRYLNEYGTIISGRYDTFVVEDGINQYDGLSNIMMDMDGKIKSNYINEEDDNNLAMLISRNGLNDSQKFNNDAYYILDDSDDINLVAITYDLSVDDILRYNSVSFEELRKGTVLRIPNQVQLSTTESITFDYDVNDTYVAKGLDISYCQPDASKIDWEKLSNSVDYLIIRVCDQAGTGFKEMREDTNFQAYYEKCQEYGIPVGVYYITHATTVQEAELEATMVADRIKGLNLTYPVYIDYENDKGSMSEGEFNTISSSGNLSQILSIEAQIINNSGFIFGVYTNKSTFASMVNMTSNDFMNNFDIWLADYDRNFDYNNIDDNGSSHSVSEEEYKLGMKQVSDNVSGEELGLGNCKVDYDLCYVNFADVEGTEHMSEQTEFEIIESKRVEQVEEEDSLDIPTPFIVGASLLGGGAIGGAGVYAFKEVSNGRARKRTRRNVFK